MSGPGATPELDEVAAEDERLDGLPVDPELLELREEPEGLPVEGLERPGLPARPVGGVEVDDELDLPVDVGGEAVEGLPGHGLPVLPELGRTVVGPDEQGDRLLEVEAVPRVDLEPGEGLPGDPLALDVVPAARDGHPAPLELPARRPGLAGVVDRGPRGAGPGSAAGRGRRRRPGSGPGPRRAGCGPRPYDGRRRPSRDGRWRPGYRGSWRRARERASPGPRP